MPFDPSHFSLLISEVANFIRKNGKHGIQLIPGQDEIFLLLFADDILSLSSTPTGLQNQINSLEKASSSLGLVVNLEKTKVMVFRKGGQIAATEKWFYHHTEIEIVNSYKYLGYTLTTKLASNVACREYSNKAKGKILDLMKTMWSLGSFDSSLFFKLFDCQVKPMLLYASEIWGTTNIHVIETAHMFACKRLLNVSDKTPNNMIYGETGRYPLLIDSTIRSLRYWLKITNMTLNRFPRQAYTMLRNDVETTIQDNQPTGLHNWANGIKECLEAYGFHDVWLNGRVADMSAFLSSFKNRMIGRFRGDWYSKISTSDRFLHTRCSRGHIKKKNI